jgi:hypothetical protein
VSLAASRSYCAATRARISGGSAAAPTAAPTASSPPRAPARAPVLPERPVEDRELAQLRALVLVFLVAQRLEQPRHRRRRRVDARVVVARHQHVHRLLLAGARGRKRGFGGGFLLAARAADDNLHAELALHLLLRVPARAHDQAEEVVPGVGIRGDEDLARLPRRRVRLREPERSRSRRSAETRDGFQRLGARRLALPRRARRARVHARAVSAVHRLRRRRARLVSSRLVFFSLFRPTHEVGVPSTRRRGFFDRGAVDSRERRKRAARRLVGVRRRVALAQERHGELREHASGKQQRAGVRSRVVRLLTCVGF